MGYIWLHTTHSNVAHAVDGFLAVLTVSIVRNLVRATSQRGYGMAWGLFGLLGPIGVIVVYCLPDRCPHQRGFPIEPTPKEP